MASGTQPPVDVYVRSPPVPRPARRVFAAAALALAAAPFLVALVAARHDGWRPLGDDAVVAVFTHDVLSTRTPLVGMPTTLTSADHGRRADHPGPLEFWALAPFDRLFGSRLGILLGVAVVNALALAIVGVTTYHLAGRGAAGGALAVGVVFAWGLGRQIVVDPWNPYIALFPLLALCVTAWASVSGRPWALPLVAGLASFVAQQHLLYLPLAVALLALASLGLAEAMLRRHRRGALRRRDVVSTVLGTVGVLVLAWLFPVFDQLAHDPGNFVAIARSYRAATGPQVGIGFAARVTAQAIGVPPLFARPSDGIARVGQPWSQLGAGMIVTAVLVVAALLTGTVLAWRRRDRVAFGAGVTAALALAVSVGVVARLPVTFPDIARYRLLQCWAVGAFTWLATGVVLARAVTPTALRLPSRVRGALRGGALAALIAVLVLAPVTVAFRNSADRQDPRLYPAVGSFAAAIGTKLDPRVTYELDSVSDADLIGLAVGYGVYNELARRGVHVRVPPGAFYLARAHSAPPGARKLIILTGRRTVDSWPKSGVLLARDEIATPEDHARLRQLTNRLRMFLRDRSNLTDKGRQVIASGAPPHDAAALSALVVGSADSIAMFDDGRLGKLWAAGLLRSDLFRTREVQDLQAARRTVDDLVFAAYLEP